MNDDRVFDMNDPHKVGPSPNSRPVITGHQPMMSDPMVNDPNKGRLPTSNRNIEIKSPSRDELGLDDEPTKPADNSHTDLFMPVDNAKSQNPMHGSGSGAPPPTDQNFSAPTNPQMPPMKQDEPAPAVNHHEGVIPPLPVGHPKGRRGGMLIVLSIAVVIVLAVGAYFFLKNHDSTHLATTDNSSSSTPSTSSNQTVRNPGLPLGFEEYKVADSGITFDYPTAWGVPALVNEAGFSKRGGTNKSDGIYAYLLTFPSNKDVQVAFTSNKYLPPARAALFYDFLQWCKGTNDAQYYKSLLHFSTTAGVDTPTTTTCDQGPLADVTKIDDNTITQAKVTENKAVIGDIYTKNLTAATIPVVRVKDATMTNSTNIKTLLTTVKTSAQNNAQ